MRAGGVCACGSAGALARYSTRHGYADAARAGPTRTDAARRIALFTGIDDPVAAKRLRAHAGISARPRRSTRTRFTRRIAVLAGIEDTVTASGLRACAVHLTGTLIGAERTRRIAFLDALVHDPIPA